MANYSVQRMNLKRGVSTLPWEFLENMDIPKTKGKERLVLAEIRSVDHLAILELRAATKFGGRAAFQRLRHVVCFPTNKASKSLNFNVTGILQAIGLTTADAVYISHFENLVLIGARKKLTETLGKFSDYKTNGKAA